MCQLQEPGQLTRKPTRNCRKHNCCRALGLLPALGFTSFLAVTVPLGTPNCGDQREDAPHQRACSPQWGPMSPATPQEHCHFPTAQQWVCDTRARQTCRLTGLAARGFSGQFHKHTRSQAMFYSAVKPHDTEIAGDGIRQEELIKGFVSCAT